MISSWVGVPAASSLTGVPSTPSGLTSPRARLKPGLPCKKLLILDSRLGGEADRAEGRGGGGGGDSCLSFSQSLVLSGVSRLRLFPSAGFVFGVVGVSGVLTVDDSGEVRVGGVGVVFVTLCRREDKPGVFVLDKALSMPSGVMSTRDRMLARAGLGGVALEAADWPDGVVGVPGDGRGDELAVLFMADVSELRMELIFPRSTFARLTPRGLAAVF